MRSLVAIFLAFVLPATAAQTADKPAAVQQLRAWLAVPRAQRPVLSSAPFSVLPLTRMEAGEALALLWQDHIAGLQQTRAGEMRAQVIEIDGLRMKFDRLSFTNTSATNGRSLFLSLHGGGGVPAAVNESQWRNQLALGQSYRPAEGIYLAPRAPTDTWNLWHQGHIDSFLDRLIENFVALENVNPNRVYLLGYSAGGDGVYQLAPRMADRFAGAAMMAGHPNDASPLGLRNLPFAIQVGANDDAYQRNAVAAKWGKWLGELRQADQQGYPHFTELHAGKGHWMDLQDRQAIPWMEKSSRVPLPQKIVWHQAARIHPRFYWLALAQPQRDQEIRAQRDGQTVTLSATHGTTVTVLLNDTLLDLDQPVTIRAGAQTLFSGRISRTLATLARTLAERGDPQLTFSAEVTVNLPGR